MEPVRSDRHDESLFDTEPSPQPVESSAAHPSEPGRAQAGRRGAGPAGGSIADGAERRLDGNYIVVHRIVGGIVVSIIAANIFLGWVIAFFAADFPVWLDLLLAGAGLAGMAAMGWMAWWWPPLEHRWTSYRVGPLGIELRKGVVFRRIITVQRSRIQHTDVSQGPIERQYGLATLQMFTAGTEHSKVDLPGLKHEIALRIRDHLVIGGEDDAV